MNGSTDADATDDSKIAEFGGGGNPMTKFYIAAAALILAATTAQAEIICTNHRGCFETGRRIFLSDGARARTGMTMTNHRGGQKDSGKPIRIRRVYYANE